jgi:16S rRNA (cytidine1402-2'-O)-methyltransferase
MKGRLILVPTPIGNMGDITFRAVEALGSCDFVACEDTRRTGLLLKHLNIAKPLKRFDDHAGARQASGIAVELALGKTICYCSDAGTPGINDPGFELARLARESGAEVVALPGPSIVTLAVAASGLPSHAFSFLGFLPSRAAARRSFLQKLAGREDTSIVFEAPHRIEDALNDINNVMPDRELALGRELTKMHETWHRGLPAQILAQLGADPRGEIVLVIAGAGAKRTIDVDNESENETSEGNGGEGPLDPLPEWAGRFLDAAREGGMTLRDAVKPLARHLGMPPSDVYKLAAERNRG